ncbi:MAG: AAA domain-containing protein [Flavobacteriales bacterium]
MENERFEQLIQALQFEREFERKQHEVLLKNTPIETRVKMGYTWFPLRVVETGFGLGDYPYIVFERTKAKGESHLFAGGKPALLFSAEPDAPKALQVAVQWVDGDQLKVIAFLDDMPELLDYGRLGLNMMVDERSYQDMEDALKKAAAARNNRMAYLRKCFEGFTQDFSFQPEESPAPELNADQQIAVAGILQAGETFLLHGPPGTGKTTTLVEAAKQLIARGEKLLLCASSNAAADWLLHKCVQAGIKTLRLGNISRVDPLLLSHTIEGYVEAHPDYKSIRQYKRKAEELRQMAGKYKRNFGFDEREQRRLLYKEARNYAEESVRLENHIIQQTLAQAQAVVSTLTGTANKLIEKMQFDTLMIDEAAQALEPACWIAIAKAEKVIFAGDPFQLPPTVKSPEAAQLGLSITLMERLMRMPQAPQHMLTVQYRMNEQIMHFSNQQFYKGKLQANASVAHHQIREFPVLRFVDTAGCGFQEEWNEETQSYANSGEIKLLEIFLKQLAKQEQEHISIGLIAPYKTQVELMKEYFRDRTADWPESWQVSIQTIDAFQGQERDVILISLVRSNEKSEIGFLKDYRRMNVALTRARKSLIVIGDSATVGADLFFKALIDHCEAQHAYESAWMYL